MGDGYPPNPTQTGDSPTRTSADEKHVDNVGQTPLSTDNPVASLAAKLRARPAAESGFTLIELLVVLVIIGILITIAVPSYLGFRDRAGTTAAKANIRSAVPVIETYYSDNDTYTGMTVAALQTIDASVNITVVSVGAATYCVSDTQGGITNYKNGPSGSITTTACT